MKKSYVIALAFLAVTAIWLLSGVFLKSSDQAGSQDSAAAQPEENSLSVRVMSVQTENVTDVITVTGRSQGSKEIDIRSEVSGLVEAISREEGAVVEAGDLLLTIEKQDKRERLSEAEKLLRQREIQYEAARKLQKEGFNSDIRLAEARTALENARASVTRAKTDLENTEIQAPFPGVLNSQSVEEGQLVEPGNALYRLVQLDPIEFSAFVTEDQVLALEAGQPVQIQLSDGRTLQAILRFIASAADPQTRTFRIIAEAPNSDHLLVSGLTVQIEIPGRQKQGAKISPSALTLNQAGQLGVKIVGLDDDIVRFRRVEKIKDTEDYMWVSGLQNGDRLITVGQDFVAEGQKVTTQEVQETAF